MVMNNTMRVVLLACAVVMAAGCTTAQYTINSPDGFVHFNKDKRVLKYISSDGVRIRAHHVKNEPYGDLQMWSDSADLHLRDAGYHELDKKDLATTDNIRGLYREYLTRFNAEDYVYALALYVDREYIYILETGGQKKYFDRHRAGVLQSVRSFSVDRR